MPIYEYQCNQCKQKFSKLILGQADQSSVECSDCQSKNVTKLISTFAIHQSEASRLSGADSSQPQDERFYQDSRNIGLWAENQIRRNGLQPNSQFKEVLEKARTGKFLEER